MNHSALWKSVTISNFQPWWQWLAKCACLLLAFPAHPSKQEQREELTVFHASCLLYTHYLSRECEQKWPRRIFQGLFSCSRLLCQPYSCFPCHLDSSWVLRELWAGLQFYFALFSWPAESFSVPSHFTPGPWLLSLPQPHHPAWLEFLAASAISCWGAQQVWVFSPLCTSVPFRDHRNVYPVFEHSYVFLVH